MVVASIADSLFNHRIIPVSPIIKVLYVLTLWPYICCYLTGLPNDNDTIYCPHNQSSCYWQQGGSYTYQQAKDRCASLGGFVASWSDGAEQLQIENYFRVGSLYTAPRSTIQCVHAVQTRLLGHIPHSSCINTGSGVIFG